MSKNDPTDKSSYTFARLALGKFGHGRITFDADSMTTCPHCNEEYNFGRQKVLNLEPKKYPDSPNKNFFYLDWEINTPSSGDPHPRVGVVLKYCKINVEDKKWDSDTITDTVTLRSHEEHGFQLNILEMGNRKDRRSGKDRRKDDKSLG